MPEDDDEDDEGGGLSLETADLKKFLKKLKTRSLTFVYAPPAGSDGEAVFQLNQLKKPKAMSTLVKKKKKEADEPGNKMSYGTIELKDDVLVLTCEKVLPGMAKKLTKLFRSKRVQAEFKILGPGGQEV